ncbi:phosphoribosyltransferase domain-containing protein [Psychrobacter arenosus]|uniref:phosphoribosyltransferase domain-containing protein n=1 Tax=Psychrobacter arenosus TaxID=256326 RepID=UPI001D108651|nr:phosphoribosyltransferase domain-containing protein [Psychrobacter arenosus]
MNDYNTALNKRTITLPRGNLDLTYKIQPPLGNQLLYQQRYHLEDLLGFAQRINPKRAFLFVSKVLGRHIPVAPKLMRRAFTNLTTLVPDNLPEPILVIGMAETAVGLSAGVHQALQARYPNALLLNSTRHAQPNSQLLTTFSEDHSHASSHLIYQSSDPAIQAQLLASKTLIMVDDEASTGNTCVNVVTALREAGLDQLQQVHLTTLVDWSLAENAANDSIGSRLPGIQFERHHLLSGAWQWTDAPNPEPITMPSVDTTEAGSQPVLDTGDWGRVPTLDSTEGFADYLAQFQQGYNHHYQVNNWQDNPLPKRILVLGSNEFVWLPFLLAEHLARQQSNDDAAAEDPNTKVKFSALTRSPIALGGAINSMLSFTDHYGLGMTNFVYNVNPSEWDLIVLCIETPADSVDAVWQNLENVLVVSPAV